MLEAKQQVEVRKTQTQTGESNGHLLLFHRVLVVRT